MYQTDSKIKIYTERSKARITINIDSPEFKAPAQYISLKFNEIPQKNVSKSNKLNYSVSTS